MVKIKALIISILNVLFPNGMFVAGILVMFLATNYNNIYYYTGPEGLNVLPIFGFCFLLIGSLFLAQFNAISEIVGTISISGKIYEVVDYGNNNYSVAKKGSAGAANLVLNFLINLLICPLMILYWLILVFLILLIPNFATAYLNKEDIFNPKAISTFVFLIAFAFLIPHVSVLNSQRKRYSLDLITASAVHFQFRNTDYYWGEARDAFDILINFEHKSNELISISGRIRIFYEQKEVYFDVYQETWNENQNTMHFIIINSSPVVEEYINLKSVNPKFFDFYYDIRSINFKKGHFIIYSLSEYIKTIKIKNKTI